MKDITIDIDDWRLNCRAAGIVIHNGKVLIHHNTKDTYYALVGGRVRLGEPSSQTVIREFKEELGKDVEITGYIATIENFFELRNTKYHEITFVYQVEFINDEDKKIKTTLKNIEGNPEKNIEYKWIDLAKIDDDPIRPEKIKQILKDKLFPIHIINDDINNYKIFDKIYNDKSIKELYNKIDEAEEKNENAWAHHNFTHVNNVTKMIEQILKDLHYSNNKLIEDAKIAGILHDIGALQGKQNHAERSYKFAKKYLKENNINLANEELVLQAIKNHSAGFDTDNIIQQVLILADKLDVKYTRITKNGLKIEGMRQMQYIKDVLINIDKTKIKVKFVCDEKINKKELEEYYFMKKVGNAIKSFASKFGLKFEVLFNEIEWKELFE